MLPIKKISIFAVPFLFLAGGACTKLDEKLGGTLTNSQTVSALGSSGPGLLLANAYADIAVPYTNQDQIFSLQENTSDESLVPTRGGDWDDNGVWRVLHNHTWNADHGQFLSVFNNLNKLNYDATVVLGFKPTPQQAAEARFLRAFACYTLLDLFGQFSVRDPGDNLLIAPKVKFGSEAITYVISELTAALPALGTSGPTSATQDACRFLLMRCYLNKGAFINRAAPTFDAADMAQVITLGNTILANPAYKYSTNYFDNFNVRNDTSKEAIFAYRNTSGVPTNHAAVEGRWNMTLHYNSFGHPGQSIYGNAGWNGFSTISDFYNSFGVSTATTNTPVDTLLDKRLGGRFYKSCTNFSGIRPGFLVGQQYDELGAPRVDRKGNPLAFTPTIASNMIETGTNLELTGIRVVKYVPDFSDSTVLTKYYGGPAGNWLMLFRFPDALLMVAEAKLRGTPADPAGALTMVNALRAARGAAPMVGPLALVNTANVDDPNTLLAERGRELYWEGVRRTDLIRFGVYLKPWGLKPNDDPKYLVFPVPNQALAANPNLKQNTGYGN